MRKRLTAILFTGLLASGVFLGAAPAQAETLTITDANGNARVVELNTIRETGPAKTIKVANPKLAEAHVKAWPKKAAKVMKVGKSVTATSFKLKSTGGSVGYTWLLNGKKVGTHCTVLKLTKAMKGKRLKFEARVLDKNSGAMATRIIDFGMVK